MPGSTQAGPADGGRAKMASGTENLLAWSTFGLAIATAALVVAGATAAIIGLRDARTSKAVAAADSRVAEASAKRRRAEATFEVVRRFLAEHDREYPTMLAAARAETAKRQAAAGPDADVARCSVQELLSNGVAPEDAIVSLRRCLDVLEEVALGARLGVYDSNIIYYLAKTKMTFMVSQGRAHIERVRGGTARGHISQSTAWEWADWLISVRFPAIQNEGAPAKMAGALDDI